MFPETGERHHLPHLHVYYQDDTAVYTLDPIDLIAGTLPRRQCRLVEAWMELYQVELVENWRLINNDEPIHRLPPLQRG